MRGATGAFGGAAKRAMRLSTWAALAYAGGASGAFRWGFMWSRAWVVRTHVGGAAVAFGGAPYEAPPSWASRRFVAHPPRRTPFTL
eukprot:7789903-Pyramimonas_sp.AAC.1